MVRVLACLAFVAFACAASAADVGPPQPGDVAVQSLPGAVRFTLITQGGYAGFTVPRDWGVIAMQSHAPVTATGFQIPDPADEGTPDSTNLAVNLIAADSPQGREVLAAGEKVDADPAVTAGRYKGWTLHTRQAAQGATLYTIVDAQAPVADVICRVRLGWPHLAAHAGDYEARMDALLKAMLDSISGQTGPYAVHAGEVVRRPDK